MINSRFLAITILLALFGCLLTGCSKPERFLIVNYRSDPITVKFDVNPPVLINAKSVRYSRVYVGSALNVEVRDSKGVILIKGAKSRADLSREKLDQELFCLEVR